MPVYILGNITHSVPRYIFCATDPCRTAVSFRLSSSLSLPVCSRCVTGRRPAVSFRLSSSLSLPVCPRCVTGRCPAVSPPLQLTLAPCVPQMRHWAASRQQPGLFSGSTGARVLSAAELSAGQQAWAKKVDCALPATAAAAAAAAAQRPSRPRRWRTFMMGQLYD